MTLSTMISSLRERATFDEPCNCIPYADFLGIRLKRTSGGLFAVMPFSDHLVGSPVPPRLHGGTIGALAEIAGVIQTAWEMSAPHLPRTIDIDIDYLRPGVSDKDTCAQARITRMGRRFANVHVEVWQETQAEPVAMARMNLLVTQK